MSAPGPCLELILARNLIATLVTPAFVVDSQGVMTFFNEAAGSLIGRHFEESGRLSREEWNEIGPVDERGRPEPSEKLPLTVALREGRPALGAFRIKTDDGSLLEVEASAIPLCSEEGSCGAMVTFVPPRGADPARANVGPAATLPAAPATELPATVTAAASAGGNEPGDG
jgi:PAS domain-containing protein